MGFPGRYGQSCFLCRSRKIKCDGTRPTCNKCHTYGKSCPGFPESFPFRSQNEKLQQKVVVTSSSSSIQHQARNPDQANGFEIPVPPNPCYEQIALGLFANQYIIQSGGDNLPGHLSYLPQLLMEQQSKCLEFALLAVAQLLAFNVLHDRWFWTAAKQKYAQAVSHLRQILSAPEVATRDETFVSVYLLTLYSRLSGDLSWSSDPHASGLYHIFRLRGKKSLLSKRDICMFGSAVPILVNTVLQGEHSFHDLSILASEVQHVNLICQLCAISTQAAALCRKASEEYVEQPNQFPSTSLQICNDERQAVVEDLLSQGSNLLEQFDTWNDSWARAFKSSRHKISDPVYSSEMCPRQAVALLLANLAQFTLAARLISCIELAGCQGHAIEFLTGSMPISAEYLKQKIDGLLTALSSNARIILGEERHIIRRDQASTGGSVGAYYLLWPMSVLAHCKYSSPEQLSVGREILLRLNSQFGLKCASRLIEQSLWIPAEVRNHVC